MVRTIVLPVSCASGRARARPLTDRARPARDANNFHGVMVKTVGMEFFCYHRDRPGSVTLRDELLEAHWAYMDRYATQMIARGPTLSDDGVPAGSMHVVDLPDPPAARAFAFDEPNY